jgi:hypothetical protein
LKRRYRSGKRRWCWIQENESAYEMVTYTMT